MKKFNLFIMIILNCAALNLKAIDEQELEKRSEQIIALENENKLASALILSMTTAYQTLKELNIGGNVAAMTSVNYDIYNEVITSKQSEGFSLFMPIIASLSYSYKGDTTKMIKANPAQSSLFNLNNKNDYSTLNEKLKNYVIHHELKLYYAKLLVAKSLQLATTLPYGERETFRKTLNILVQTSQKITFKGSHTTVKCTTKNYTARTSSENGSARLLFASLSGGRQWEQLAHSETDCNEPVTNNAMINDIEMLSYRLHEAEFLIGIYSKKFGSSEVLDAQAPYTPDWGIYQN